MKPFLVLLLLLTFNYAAFSQDSNEVRVDSNLNYQVKIPSWLHVIETGSSNIFGGTLPAVNGIENAIAIQGFLKSQFKSFDEFKDIFLTGNKFGQPTKFDSEVIWYGQQQLVKIENGVKQRVFTFWQNNIYHNQFVLLQTNTAYILIKYVSTPETYDLNLSKFEEFLGGFKITNSVCEDADR
jgi:hypothetical protein